MSTQNTTKNKSNHAKRMARKDRSVQTAPDPKKIAKEKREATKALLKKVFTVVVCALLVLLFALPSVSGLMSCSSVFGDKDSNYSDAIEELEGQLSEEEGADNSEIYLQEADEYLAWSKAIYTGAIADSSNTSTDTAAQAVDLYETYGDTKNDAECALHLGEANAFAGEYDTAASQLKTIVDSDSKNAEAWAYYGFAVSMSGDNDTAIEALQKAVDLDAKSDAGKFAKNQLEYLQGE